MKLNRKKWTLGIAATLAISVASAAYADEADDGTYKVFWKNGLNLASSSKAWTAKIGGRIHYDWMFAEGDEKMMTGGPTDNFNDGVAFRRARMHISGTMQGNVDYKIEMDFAGGAVGFRDVTLGVGKLPFGTIRVGHQIEANGLEIMTSSNATTFMERGHNVAFTPEYNTGLQVFGNAATDDMISYNVGLMYNTAEAGGGSAGGVSADGKMILVGRLTGVPYFMEEGKKLVHLGVNYRMQAIEGAAAAKKITFSDRGAMRYPGAKALVSSTVTAESATTMGAEVAVVFDSLSVQGEYHTMSSTAVDGTGADEPTFDAYYVYASYMLTGEVRSYKKAGGVFDRPKVKAPFMGVDKGGMGAFELAVRYSAINLNDDTTFDGGEMNTITFGLNWYLNDNTQVKLNYVLADVTDKTDTDLGSASFLGLRFMVDF